MSTKKQDQFDQIMGMSVVQSGVNTLTFGSVSVGISIFDYAAFIISRIEYNLSQGSLGQLTAAADFASIAICGSNNVSDIFDVSEPSVYDRVSLGCIDSGAPATHETLKLPLVSDFSSMKGGGILVPAQDIYIGLQTAGFASIATATARVYYTVKPLDASDYIELAQRLRVLST